MRASALSLRRNKCSTYKKYVSALFLFAPCIRCHYFQKRWQGDTLFVAAHKLILNVSKIRLRLIFSRSSHPACLFSKGTVFPLPIVSGKTSGTVFLFNEQLSLADCCILFIIIMKKTKYSTALFRAPLSLRYLSAEITAERCTAKAIFINCFCSLSIAVRGRGELRCE